MALRKTKIAGRSFGPIVHLDEGETVMLVITDIRDNVGPHSSTLIGARQLGGEEISLPGHAILVDKLMRSERVLPSVFELARKTKIGEAIDYEVEAYDYTEEQILADKGGAEIVKATASLLQAKIDALPPRA